MPDTENSINELGIPQISLTVSPSQNVMTPVDATLSIADMAADAKATGDAIGNIGADISDLTQQVDGIDAKTGEDIPLTSEDGSITIAELLPALYPVGSIYATANGSLPDILSALGAWEEVYMPLKWGDIKYGTRSYEPASEAPGGIEHGNMHYWLRTM